MLTIEFPPPPSRSGFAPVIGADGQIIFGAVPLLLLSKAEHLYPLMIFPSDDEARSQYKNAWSTAIWKHMLEHYGIDTRNGSMSYLTGRAAANLANAPTLKELSTQTTPARERGRIAGLMFYFILQCAAEEQTQKYASVAAACRMVNGLQDKKRGYDVNTIKRYTWDPYRSVAHLWAAVHAWQLAGHLKHEQELLLLPDSTIQIEQEEVRDRRPIQEFLALAELFREEGEGWSHEKGPAILDPNETWRCSPDMAATLPQLCYAFYPPEPDLLKMAEPPELTKRQRQRQRH
jgi:hypothetical protein